MKIIFCFFCVLIFFISMTTFPQSINDPVKMPIQFRRGIEVPPGYQSYEQKYQGRNLLKEKRRLYPLDEITSGTGVWTELNPKVPRVDYLGIHFVNTDTGWACGDLGTIIKSTDGGQNWITEETNTTTPILKVNSFNGQTVIASGFNGLILCSTDGGDSWTQMISGVTGDLWGLQMINDTLGWACGKSNSLIKTTDAGLTWTRIFTPGYTSDYWWIDFLDENYGFIAANGKVIRTTDGGISWEIIQAGDNQALYSVDAIDRLNIAAAGYGGTGYRGKTVYSNDGGNTWLTGGPTTFDPINCIKYVNPDTGYFVMSEVGLWKTTNKGQNWRLLDSIPLTNIGEFEIQLFKQQNVGYDAGSGLKIYKADENLDSWHKLIINDDFNDVFFTSEHKGFVLSGGLFSKLFKTTDAGLSWDIVPGVPGGNCITFTDSLTGYYGTTASQIYKTTDGGENWYPTNGIITRVAKILFINHQTGWAVGESRIYKTNDGGENWVEQLNRPGAGFTSISSVDSLYGWASLGGWKPYKTTDGGLNWIEQTNLDFLNTNDVYFTNIDTGFIINGFIGNNLYKTVDAGSTWQPDTIIDAAYNFNFFPNKYHWILNGVHQRWETRNNGITWNEITLDVPGFNRFQAPKEWIGYAVGGGGLILRYMDTAYVPVELISFEGKSDGKKIFLNWETASELNDYGFDIEKSFDEKNWIKIGFMSGEGSTIEPHSYSFIDTEISSAIQYYRLKQLDYNSSYKFSKVVEINSDLNSLTIHLSQNYPNPFNNSTSINYYLPSRSFVNISLYNVIGEKLADLINEEKDEGNYKFVLDCNKLSSGIYFIRMKTEGGYNTVIKIVQIK